MNDATSDPFFEAIRNGDLVQVPRPGYFVSKEGVDTTKCLWCGRPWETEDEEAST